MKNYFYIIQRDGHIFEIEFTEERFNTALSRWQDGGIIVFSVLGVAVNATDIVKILNAEQYKNYIDSAQPRMFIKNGTWYDIKERNTPVRHEAWKQLQIDEEKNKLLSSGEGQATKKEISSWIKKYRPDFTKNDVIKKMQVTMKK